jgi:hypothetical protein
MIEAGQSTEQGIQTMPSSVEAVIISGPRRGEIVQIADETVVEVSDEDIVALNTALDDLLVAIDRVATEMRTTIDTLSKPAGQS